MRAFEGQVAVVTGASSGIGRAMALALGREGAALCLLGQDPNRLGAVAAEAGVHTDHVIHHRADFTSESQVRSLIAWLLDELEALDLLVHCAGLMLMGAIETAPVEDLDRQFQVNVRSPFIITQVLLPLLRAQKGQIVFVNSSAVQRAKANVGQYAATKHALRGVADSLREEVNAQGVRVLSVYPGRTATPIQERICAFEGQPYEPHNLLQPDDVAAAVVQALRIPRSAEITDIHIRPHRRADAASSQ